MRKSMKMSAVLLMSTLVYTGCTEKETAVPTVDYARADALRSELRSLQQQVLGANATSASVVALNTTLKRDTAAIKAEISRLQVERARKVKYIVYVADLQGAYKKDAEVSMAVDGAVVKKIADADGKAVFDNVRAGVVNVVVKLAGFTTANYVSSIAFGKDIVDTKVPVLPLTATTGPYFTLKGNVYANLSAADDNLNRYTTVDNIESPAKKVTINVLAGPNSDETSVKYDAQARKITATVELNGVPGTTGISDVAGEIQRIAYENAVFSTTSAADGSYSLQLPALVDAAGEALDGFDDYVVSLEQFAAPYTFLLSGLSSNTDYDNNPYNLYRNLKEDGSMLPETTVGYVKLFSASENRVFRFESFSIGQSTKIGASETKHIFYESAKN
ncbi:MAG: hypothetical protein H7Z75_17675 [Ferruginibacter sp.]|nr:hypothetical protein [Cytophagales bacterium]